MIYSKRHHAIKLDLISRQAVEPRKEIGLPELPQFQNSFFESAAYKKYETPAEEYLALKKHYNDVWDSLGPRRKSLKNLETKFGPLQPFPPTQAGVGMMLRSIAAEHGPSVKLRKFPKAK